MLDDQEFKQLMQLTRKGNREAARRLVELYEPEIRRAARLRMTDPKLRRIVDSMDICQSVFGKFFRSATEGELQLESPEQLMGLLVTMTRNRVVDEHRKQNRKKRNSGEAPILAESYMLVEDSPGPKTAFALKELLAQVRSKFSADELEIADRRNAGMTWEEIAAELDESGEVLRKRLERALQRVRGQFANPSEGTNFS
jgi:RNA polymerase sigma-70 factor (ECF subfamily)